MTCRNTFNYKKRSDSARLIQGKWKEYIKKKRNDTAWLIQGRFWYRFWGEKRQIADYERMSKEMWSE